MKSIKQLNEHCKKKGKQLVIDGNIHSGYVNVELDSEIDLAKRMHKKHKKGRVF